MTNEMSRDERRAELSRRVNEIVELQNNPDLKTKGEHQQRRKCTECGKSYLGQAHSSTCGDACRKRKQRK